MFIIFIVITLLEVYEFMSIIFRIIYKVYLYENNNVTVLQAWRATSLLFCYPYFKKFTTLGTLTRRKIKVMNMIIK